MTTTDDSEIHSTTTDSVEEAKQAESQARYAALVAKCKERLDVAAAELEQARLLAGQKDNG